MTYAQKQKRVFSKLVDINLQISNWFKLSIWRTLLGDFEIKLYSSQKLIKSWIILPWKLKTAAEINAEIDKIWREIPAECKKSPDPKTEHKRLLEYISKKP